MSIYVDHTGKPQVDHMREPLRLCSGEVSLLSMKIPAAGNSSDWNRRPIRNSPVTLSGLSGLSDESKLSVSEDGPRECRAGILFLSFLARLSIQRFAIR
jgi:hypothetical protein